MKTKKYEKPTMKVVMLQHTTHLLEASKQGVSTVRSGYGSSSGANTQTWGDEQ